MNGGRTARTFVIFLLLFTLLPSAASALTPSELNAQIQSILARVATLQEQLRALQASPATTGVALRCPTLSRTLQRGMRGEDVASLQRFLIAVKVLADENATGFFGALTEEAVQKWQGLQGIVSSGEASSSGFGVVGPKTRAAIVAICAKGVQLRTKNPTLRVCPLVLPPPASAVCDGAWEKGYDTGGCVSGYQCSRLEVATTTTRRLPSIVITSPAAGTAVAGGRTLHVGWQSDNAPSGARVTLSLLDDSGKNVGTIAQNLALAGTYLWQVPEEESGCARGEIAFDCILKLSHCTGSESMCSLPSGIYTIRAALSPGIATTSPSFEIVASPLFSLIDALSGAPSEAPTSTDQFSTSTPVEGACMHESASYPPGSTISVACETGKCTSESAGYITGTCTNGLWCIPFTTFCAPTFAQIDVSSYQGGNAAPIGSGYGVNCGTNGWRAYLSCPMGSCKTGFHICRGGTWVYDESQDVDL